MQGHLRRKSREPGLAADGEFCDVISTLTHDLTKARNQLVRLMHQAKPDYHKDRLYGGYSAGNSNVPRTCNRSPVRGKENPANYQPPRPSCSRPKTAPQRPAPKQRDHRRPQPQRACLEKIHPCTGPYQSDTADSPDAATDATDVSGAQSEGPCINITFDAPDPPECQRCCCCCCGKNNMNSRVRPVRSLRSAGFCDDFPRLQGGFSGDDLGRFLGRGKRHDAGKQFAAQLGDITVQLQQRRLGPKGS